jgi:hypothetical protein
MKAQAPTRSAQWQRRKIISYHWRLSEVGRDPQLVMAGKDPRAALTQSVGVTGLTVQL